MSELSANSKTPAIRFKGFSGEWGVKTMLDCSSRIGDGLHGTPKYTDNTGIYFINGNNLVSGSIFITDETKQVDKEEQSKVDNSLNINTILISINGTIGNLAWYRNESIMLGKSIAYISLENCTPSYVYFYLQTKRVNEYFSNNLTGSTIKNLGLKAIREAKVVISKDKKEQTQIGNFFQQLDRLIAQHQQKHDKLLSVKKALLEKMFPKQGETQPAIRFKGFSGAWEEKALGEVAQITMGQSPSGENYTDNPQDNILVQGNADMKNGQVVPRIWTTQVTKKADAGDLIFSVRAPVGEVGKTSFDIVIGRGVAAIKGNEFIFQSLKKMNDNNYWSMLSAGSTFDSINSNDLSNARISITKPKEQTKIGSLFQQLDSLINQQQSQLTKLGNIKQAMLAKMFA